MKHLFPGVTVVAENTGLE